MTPCACVRFLVMPMAYDPIRCLVSIRQSTVERVEGVWGDTLPRADETCASHYAGSIQIVGEALHETGPASAAEVCWRARVWHAPRGRTDSRGRWLQAKHGRCKPPALRRQRRFVAGHVSCTRREGGRIRTGETPRANTRPVQDTGPTMMAGVYTNRQRSITGMTPLVCDQQAPRNHLTEFAQGLMREDTNTASEAAVCCRARVLHAPRGRTDTHG